jgi:alpha-glucosidase
VIAKNKDGLSIVIAESDRKDYPGLWLRKSSDTTLRADFSPAVKDSSKYDKEPEHEDHIAETTMKRKFPWRIFSVHDKESSIAEDQIVETLAHTDNPEAFTWVKPGKAAWDWWNLHDINGVDFKRDSTPGRICIISISPRDTV